MDVRMPLALRILSAGVITLYFLKACSTGFLRSNEESRAFVRHVWQSLRHGGKWHPLGSKMGCPISHKYDGDSPFSVFLM